jgi:CDP-diacylglycerol--glycerol-3-phosphate 3-phosphatidyltransferase
MALASGPPGALSEARGNDAGRKGHEPHPLSTLANQLTISRLLLAVVFFALLEWGPFTLLGLNGMIWALVLFVIATATDALDGYLARRWQQVTTLGRILDPFVDKIIVCGAFIFLLPLEGSGLLAWMVTLIVARELLVTAIRSFLERHGADFSATWSGKIKMVLQCVTIGWILLHLGLVDSLPSWSASLRNVLIWSTLAATLISGIVYLRRAAALLS